MKILHILYSGLGGHGNVFFSIIKADENKDFQYEAIFAGVEGIREEYVTKSNFNKIQWNFFKKDKKLDIVFNKKIVDTIKASTSSIIFLHGSRYVILARLASFLSKTKKKIIVRETQANHLKTKSEWVFLWLAMFFADKIVFLTDKFNDEVKQKLGFFYRPGKISVINNGMDLSFFKPLPKLPSKIIVMGMQSRIVPIKDHKTLLHAFSILQTEHPELLLQLKIAGDGESLPAIKVLATQLKLDQHVIFTGMLNEVNLVSFMQSLDIYIHASYGETMSTAVMQAMACKLPIIASNVAGINNMIENGKTGILVPLKDARALADGLFTIINNPIMADEMKQAAFNFANHTFSNKTMFNKYKAIFESFM